MRITIVRSSKVAQHVWIEYAMGKARLKLRGAFVTKFKGTGLFEKVYFKYLRLHTRCAANQCFVEMKTFCIVKLHNFKHKRPFPWSPLPHSLTLLKTAKKQTFADQQQCKLSKASIIWDIWHILPLKFIKSVLFSIFATFWIRKLLWSVSGAAIVTKVNTKLNVAIQKRFTEFTQKVNSLGEFFSAPHYSIALELILQKYRKIALGEVMEINNEPFSSLKEDITRLMRSRNAKRNYKCTKCP